MASFGQIFCSSTHWQNPFMLPDREPGQKSMLSTAHKAAAIGLSVVPAISVAACAVSIGLIIKASLVIAALVAAVCAVAMGVFAFYAACALFKCQSLAIELSPNRPASDDALSPDLAMGGTSPSTAGGSSSPLQGGAAPSGPSSTPLAAMQIGTMPGLPNVGGSCWLNSVLKFIASTTAFDGMLFGSANAGIRSGGLLARAQHLLHEAVLKLRRGEALTDQACRNLRLALPCIMRGCERGSQDAEEFLSALFNKCGCNPVISVYPEAQENEVSIEPTLMQEVFSNNWDPECEAFCIKIEGFLNHAPIYLEADGTITLCIDQPSGDEIDCYKYKLAASMKNTGGHWIFYECQNAPNNGVLNITRHDDARVGSSTLQAMKNSEVFLFRRVYPESC
jgi:hypothetical protein